MMNTEHILAVLMHLLAELVQLHVESRQQRDVSAMLDSHLNLSFIDTALRCCPLANASKLPWE